MIPLLNAYSSLFGQFVGYLFVILLPILALYLVYLIVTKAFHDMGFSSFEAIIIVFVSFLLGSGLIDDYIGISFSNIPLFWYHTSWVVGINVGGAVIPILLSIYLSFKNKLNPLKIVGGIGCVAVVTFFVTSPDPERGIVSTFPYWLFPIMIASAISIWVSRKETKKAAPVAYTIGTLGVLIGADGFHLVELLHYQVSSTRFAVIGGASVFDMVFITGILAVFLDGLLIFQKKRKNDA